MPKRRTSPSRFVTHPRYGALPHTSGIAVSEEEIREGFWSLRRETMFPESVLVARTEEQNYAVFPRRYYVDVLRSCRSCCRKFIFFAKEQRYWFETLKFFVDADCVLCPDCRRTSRLVQRRVRRYSDLMKRKARTMDELQTLVDDATYLFEHGTLRNVSILGALKNEARKSIPEYAGTVALTRALTKARRARSAP
jgi:hypothetical protein